MDIKVGDILVNRQNKTNYRIISIIPESFILCEMNTSKFSLLELSKNSVFNLIDEGDAIIEGNDESYVYDIDQLTDSYRETFYKKKAMMTEITNIYGPDFLRLNGNKPKPELMEIMKKYDIPKNTMWRTITKYFQSGLNTKSLINDKAWGNNKGKTYNYVNKPGKRNEYLGAVGIVKNEDIEMFYAEALNNYKSGRQKSIRSAYDLMNNKHFTKTEIINGIPSLVLMPISERPTYAQFYYYMRTHLSVEEKDIIKTSKREHRNNKRLLISDSLYGITGPGDMVEIDACEADISLVSSVNRSKVVGRPTVYFMIDVYSRIILAASIKFEQNSNIGITNLFLNLADDKKEFCEKYGISFNDDRLWPSNIIPRRVRVDRGSEFISKEFDRICLTLGIEKNIVPGGTGSLKGVVEQSFHQMHSRQNVHLENYGLIEKRYDSKHHKEATLDINQYTKMVINFVLYHNQQYLDTYPLTKDMIEKKVMAIPAMLWEYGVKNLVNPKPIINKTQFLYDLMTPIKATISKRGICYKKLWYISDNTWVTTQMFVAKTKKIPFEARMDMRSIDAIYFIHDGELVRAELNERLSGNATFKGLTMRQYDDYLKEKRTLDKNGEIHNQELSAFNYIVNEQIVKEAKSENKNVINDSKHILPIRNFEKQLISKENAVEQRLDITSGKEYIPEIEEKTKMTSEVKDFMNLTKEELEEERRKAFMAFEEED